MRQLAVDTFKLILLFGSLSVLFAFQFSSGPQVEPFASTIEADKLKLAAFEILQAKCNSCHLDQNPRRVFTLQNMDDLAPKINRQVFVFKRMPKGKEKRKSMTVAEMMSLRNWLNAELNKN